MNAILLGLGIGALAFALLAFLRLGRLNKAQIESRAGLDALKSGRWRDLAHFATDVFVRRGFEVNNTVNQKDALGVDLILSKPGETQLVMCKHWGNHDIGVTPVQSLLSLLPAKGANGGIIVTTGKFAEDAWQLAAGRPLELIDGEALWREARHNLSPELLERVTQKATQQTKEYKRNLISMTALGAVIGVAIGSAMQMLGGYSKARPALEPTPMAEVQDRSQPQAIPTNPTDTPKSDDTPSDSSTANATAKLDLEAEQTAERDLASLRQSTLTRILASPGVMLGTWSTDTTLSISLDGGGALKRDEMLAGVCAVLKEIDALKYTRLQISMLNTGKDIPVMFKKCD